MAVTSGQTYCVGLTGGIASGKSAVASAFEALGIVVADADIAAREAVALGSGGLAEVIASFGTTILDQQGALDRVAMRKRVFADTAARQQLESIIHPRVREALAQQCTEARSVYAIAAIPLLTEVGGRAAYPWLQRILVVDVPVETQRSRLISRDSIDAALAEKMINVQASRQQRFDIADDILVNVRTLADLRQQVAVLDDQYRKFAALIDMTQSCGI